MRLATDTGGTFTDLVVEADDGALELFKAPTTPDNPVRGIKACLDLAAVTRGTDRAGLLRESDMFTHATTRGINAILTGTTARTAFVTTEGHRDILLYREGGRSDPFNFAREYPPPYVPRRLTFELPERIAADGDVIRTLGDEDILRLVQRLRDERVEAVAVCLLWSILNPAHELRVGELLDEHLPGVAVTLSHRLNPTIREYRRASSACIDASLKSLMTSYLSDLDRSLRADGFQGRLYVVSSAGGLLDLDDALAAPILTLGSGPAMAPVAGRHYADADKLAHEALIVTDTGGTSFDVSLVESGSIPWTREVWLGKRYSGDITGFPAIDVKSIGAGGGSIAWVDDGGLLRVGPQSAGAKPGPACYPRGGVHSTLTDACVALGYLDPDRFLNGAIRLDREAAITAIERDVAGPLHTEVAVAAAAVVDVATEQMVRAIEETTLYRGLDPATAVIVGGGGAAGFTICAIAKRLGCRHALVPSIGPGLSAAGALVSDLVADYTVTAPTATSHFDFDVANGALQGVSVRAAGFAEAAGMSDPVIEHFAEARYPHQVWEIEVPLPQATFSSLDDAEALRAAFHSTHRRLFGVEDPDSPVEIVSWRARVTCRVGSHVTALAAASPLVQASSARRAYFPATGWVEAVVHEVGEFSTGTVFEGPAFVDTPHTTVVVPPGATVRLTDSNNLVLDPVAVPVAGPTA
jgi:N-methylhydantoinase A